MDTTTDATDPHADLDDFFADVDGPPPRRRQAQAKAQREPITLTVEQLTARHPRVRCTAHSSRHGRRCQAWAMRGMTVCVAHGGKAPQVRDAADRRVMVAQAMRAAADMPPPRSLAGDDDGMAEWAAGVLDTVRRGKRWR